MPRRITMANLVTRCQRRCDRENDDHIGSAEWKALISAMYGELYSVVAEAGLRYFETRTELVGDGTQDFAEPADHYATIGVDYIVGGVAAGNHDLKERRELAEVMAQERVATSGLGTGEARYFAIVDDVIKLYPIPTSGQVYELLYIPQPPDLGTYADDDLVDVVTPDGEEFLVWGTCVKALAKSESDVRLAMAERESARERLVLWAALRSFNGPRRRMVSGSPWDDGFSDSGDWRR